MPKRSRSDDPNEAAFRVVQEVISKHDEPAPMLKKAPQKRKNPAAVALGRKGGLKGGVARAAKLTPQERSESARLAAVSRWSKPNE